MIKQIAPIALLMVIFIASCGESPIVAQGVVSSYDTGTKMLVLKNDLPSNPELVFSLQIAEFGVEPAVGDSVRIAYRDEGGKLIALRIMNLSKQTELKKKGH